MSLVDRILRNKHVRAVIIGLVIGTVGLTVFNTLLLRSTLHMIGQLQIVAFQQMGGEIVEM